MEKYSSALLARLHEELREVSNYENELQRFERSYYIVEAKMKELKEFIQNYTFKGKEEEVRFFKEIKPLFQKEVIYYNELFNIESKHPVTTGSTRKQYYEKVLERIIEFFDQYRDLYNYHRSGKSSQDEFYFLRSDDGVRLHPPYVLDFDPQFSTPYSSVLATLQGYEQLCDYINQTFYEGQPSGTSLSSRSTERSTWSASKAALIELAVALYFSGSVNFGQGGFKKFIAQLEAFFNIQLGNVYRVFLGMVIRKKEPAPFLHILVDTFLRKLDDKSM